jgi:DNA-binding IclR family transcriptional regulator
MWLNLDHRAGFLLAQVDGTVNFEELFALSGLPRLDTARILSTLLADGVIR